MSTKPPPLHRIRYADIDDASSILSLINESISKNFRVSAVSDVVDLIENCVLSICQVNAEGAIVGFIAAKDYPPIPSVHPIAWPEYIWTKYKMIEMNPRNTLFLHLLCWSPVYGREAVDRMLKSMFLHDPYLHFIGLIKSDVQYPLLMPGQARAEGSFRRVPAKERGVTGDQVPALCVSERGEVCPRLRIRRAVEEDNDDIVPIVERHSTRLREMYGDYYVSELISRHPESERVLLVCEHKELAVGVMSLNTEINYCSLEECFDLAPFAGLRHVDGPPTYHRANHTDVSESCLNVNRDSSCLLETMSGAMAKEAKHRVTWTYEDDDFSAAKGSGTPRASTDQLYAHLAMLDLLEDDEEEMEFDIVNIAPELLKLPDLMTPADNYHRNILDGRQKQKAIDDRTPRKEKKKPIKQVASASMGVAVKSPEQITRYSGSPNAFLLELFAMHSDYDERYGFDMLEVAFELFPDREYCVICLPSKHPAFPLLEHFTLVTPRCTRLRFINETLFVAHVNSVRGNIRVRPGEASDLVNLSDILEHAPRRQLLTELFENSLVSSALDSFVLLSQNQPVGVIVVGPLEEGISIRTQYNLEPEPRRPESDCTVLAGVVSPVMEPHSRWFLREVIRQSGYYTLLWMCQPIAKGDASPRRNMMSLAERMVPVRPRLVVPNISGNKDLDRIFKDMATPFSLWAMERALSGLPKACVNCGIVVVGASRVGLAFLEKLIMGPTASYLTFTNLTLVSTNGLPAAGECLRAADTCVPRRGRYTDRHLKTMPFCFYVDVVADTMVHIDRKKKCIYLKGGGVKHYDELVLACGQQFQHPDYMRGAMEIVSEIRKGKPCDRILMDNPKYQPDRVPPLPDLPENVMLINSLYQANISLRKLLRMVSEDKAGLSEANQIVVYGDCIQAYCCMAALLELGVDPKHVTFVEPFPPEDQAALRVNCFNDEEVDERVQLSLSQLGIRTIRQCRLVDWSVAGARVESLRLMGPLRSRSLPCFALFYYGIKAIDLNAFRAINCSGLVYDGGLVVGPLCETNDPHVRAAGSCTRHSRRLYTRIGHGQCHSEAVGEALAQIFLTKLNPFTMEHPEYSDCPADLFPRFSGTFLSASLGSVPNGHRLSITHASRRWQPVIQYPRPLSVVATLPGPLYYYHLRKPGPVIPMEVQLCMPRQGHTLVTDKDSNYFRLQLNALHCVAAVTCLSRRPVCRELLDQLYGRHEEVFNKLLARYQLQLIDDLFDYFGQPWMAALYQETFADMIDHMRQKDMEEIYENVKSMFGHTAAGKSAVLTQACCDLTCDKLSNNRAVDILSECGQSAGLRGAAAAYWQAAGGEQLLLGYIGRYLARNSVTNPHYAQPPPHVDHTEKIQESH